MVTIKKRKGYYSLEQTYREEGKVKKREIYLGKEIPLNIEELKKEVISETYKEMWLSKIDKIKQNYVKEQNRMPLSAKKKEQETFMIKFTYNTQKIEGSTLTLRETANLLEKGITPKEKSLTDVEEAQAHKEVFYEMLAYQKELTLQEILFWHKKLFEHTQKDIAGKLREHQVAIAGSKFLPPLPVEINTLLQEFFNWYKKESKQLHPVILAALVHLKFVTIHPFSDGNGRISRIMMNFVLHKYNYPLFDITYTKRTSYYRALERAQIKKQETIFIQWFLKKYIQEHVALLKKAVKEDVQWGLYGP